MAGIYSAQSVFNRVRPYRVTRVWAAQISLRKRGVLCYYNAHEALVFHRRVVQGFFQTVGETSSIVHHLRWFLHVRMPIVPTSRTRDILCVCATPAARHVLDAITHTYNETELQCRCYLK